MSVHVVISTGLTGGGHFAQAEAFAGALQGRALTAITDGLHPSVLRVHRPATRNRLTRTLYGLIWRATNNPPGARLLRALTPSRRRGYVCPPFDVAVATHPLTVGLLVDAARPRGRAVICWCPEMGEANNHALYATPPRADYFLFGHERGMERFHRVFGIPRERMRWCGFPLRPVLCAPRGARAAHRLALGLDPQRPTVLLTAGGEGTGPIQRFARALAARPRLREVQVLVACGRNETLRRTLARPLRAFGPLPAEGMRDLIAAADVVCGLSCGVTQIMETALFGGAPFIAIDSLDGQERENEALLRELGIGAACRPMPAAAAMVEAALTHPGQLTTGIEALAARHADAPRRAADAVLEAAGGWR